MCGMPLESTTRSISVIPESLPSVSTDHIPLSYAANLRLPLPES